MSRTWQFCKFSFAVAAFVVSCAPFLQAQSIFGTITGTISDATGAVVPRADVILTNKTSGDVRRSTSNSDGYFSFSSVPAAQYDLLVTAAGFKK